MKQEQFDEFIEAYTKLPRKRQQEEILKKLKNIVAITMMVGERFEINQEILLNKELLDLKTDNVSEKDFYEGVFVYINSLEESLCALLENIMDNKYN